MLLCQRGLAGCHCAAARPLYTYSKIAETPSIASDFISYVDVSCLLALDARSPKCGVHPYGMADGDLFPLRVPDCACVYMLEF